MNWQALGKRIRQARGQQTQNDYAQALGGFTQRQISDLENGKMRDPSPDMAAMLTERFGPLPTQDAPADDLPPLERRVEELLTHVRKEAVIILRAVPEPRWDDLVDRLKQHVTAAAGLILSFPEAHAGSRRTAKQKRKR